MNLPHRHLSILVPLNGQHRGCVGFARAKRNKVKYLQSGTVTQRKQGTTLPTGPIERLIEYQAPFTRSDRETDYATVWRKLEEQAS